MSIGHSYGCSSGSCVWVDWGFGDFQSLKTTPGEHPQQPIEPSQLGRTRTDALFILPAPWHVYSSAELVAAATQAHLPTIGVERYHHAGGALLTYGADIAALA